MMEFNGRPLRRGENLGDLMKNALEQHLRRVGDHIQAELEALRCAEHAECILKSYPTEEGVQLKGSSCDAFRQLVEQRLAELGAEPNR